VTSFRGIDGLTCDNSQSSVVSVGLDISGEGGRFRNIYIKGTSVAGIRVGTSASGPTSGMVFENITGCVDSSCAGVGGNVLSTLILLAPSDSTDFGVSIRGLNFIGTPALGTFILNDMVQPLPYCDQSAAQYDEGPMFMGSRTRYTTANKTTGCT
jgi:hypothetical protein